MNFLRFLKKLIKCLTSEPNSAIVVEETPTTEKTSMKIQSEVNPVNYVRDWAIEKIELLHESDRHKNAKALAAEFDEWINLPEGEDEISYLCIEEDWTDDQEVDVQ